jgi:hypothetical protein
MTHALERQLNNCFPIAGFQKTSSPTTACDSETKVLELEEQQRQQRGRVVFRPKTGSSSSKEGLLGEWNDEEDQGFELIPPAPKGASRHGRGRTNDRALGNGDGTTSLLTRDRYGSIQSTASAVEWEEEEVVMRQLVHPYDSSESVRSADLVVNHYSHQHHDNEGEKQKQPLQQTLSVGKPSLVMPPQGSLHGASRGPSAISVNASAMEGAAVARGPLEVSLSPSVPSSTSTHEGTRASDATGPHGVQV